MPPSSGLDDALEALALPLDRACKLHALATALEVQTEDGGDHPEVNAHLIAALQLATVH